MTEPKRAHTWNKATKRSDRDRSVVGVRLNDADLITTAKQTHGEKAAGLTNGPSPQGLYQVERGGYMLVNGEGVHTVSDAEGRIVVWLSHGMMWVEIELDIADVIDCTNYVSVEGRDTPEPINLADNIRQFGDRLERNFSLAWDRAQVWSRA